MATLLQALIGGRFRAFDSNGVPLAGGQLYAYQAGTTTPQDTFTTSAGTVANANPVVLNASGEADVWLGTTGNYKFVLKDASSVIQWTVDNYPPAGGGSGSGTGPTIHSVEPGGRLTLTSGTPVTTGDVTGATTIYYAPYKHDNVPIYDGTSWTLYGIGAGISQATNDTTKSPAAVVNNSNYDLFVWNDAGTLRLSRGPLWTSDTARGTGIGTTELTQVAGKYVNKNAITNGPAALTGLYVGTVRSDGSAHINDSMTLRHAWNMYNRVQRPMRVLEATATWIYNTATWRQANGAAGNQVSFVIGLSEDAVSARAQHSAFDNSGTVTVVTGIGLDSTAAPEAACVRAAVFVPTASAAENLTASWEGFPGLGYHYLAWLEYGGVSGGSTFFQGINGQTQSGMLGEVRA